MGMSVVAAAGILMLSLTFLFVSISLNFLWVWEDALKHESDIRSDIIKNSWTVSLRVETVSFISNTEVEINVTNVGSTGIPESYFKFIDVLIVYYPEGTGERAVEYLNYDPAGGSGTWHIVSVVTSGSEGESLNPICPCPAAGKGVWDPLETLVIKATLTSSANTTKPVNAVIASPWGQRGYG